MACNLIVNRPIGRILSMREKLLDVAEQLVQERGLSSVTFQELADAVGLRKPSVFHHIPNKEALAIALIERCSTKHAPQYQQVVDLKISAPEKLLKIAEIFDDGLQSDRPCLIAALGAGKGTLSAPAQQKLKAKADATIELYAQVFQQGHDEVSLDFEGTPEEVATGFFAMLQGLQTLSRAVENPSALMTAARHYINRITV